MISVIIVNYNAGKLLAQCLESLRREVTVPFEVILVDNASQDNSLENLPSMPHLKVLRETYNWGFAKACNLGAAQARGEILHFLNPDAQVGPDINAAYAAVGDGLYSTKIVDQNAVETKVGFAFPTFANLYRLLISKRAPDCWFIGASVLAKAATFRHLGGFSEDYNLYAEDTDLFYKAHLQQIPIAQLEARVLHAQGGSSNQVWNSRQRLIRVETSARKFADKFGLRFSYFIFRHLGFAKGLLSEPGFTLLEVLTFWQVMLFKVDNRLPGSSS